ncbi:Phosphatidylethanolamine-binding protein [uncultured archaeon]|nr:Phosphatidylethanolamine-binding protein [uncultured archaeon]
MAFRIGRSALAGLAALALIFVGAMVFLATRNSPRAFEDKGGLLLSSPAFSNGSALPEKYSCQGEAVSPPLSISGIPAGTKSLTLVVKDPDAPIGTFYHLVAWNIPVAASIAENSSFSGGTVGMNTAGQNKYVGACPPYGTHRYVFQIYALDAKLSLPASAGFAELEAAMQGRVLAQAGLTALYSKS